MLMPSPRWGRAGKDRDRTPKPRQVCTAPGLYSFDPLPLVAGSYSSLSEDLKGQRLIHQKGEPEVYPLEDEATKRRRSIRLVHRMLLRPFLRPGNRPANTLLQRNARLVVQQFL